MDDFYQTVERLPELRATGLRQRLGSTPLFHESETSLGHFRFSPSDDQLHLDEYEAFRADTHQQLLLPQTYFDWLNVTPHAGARLALRFPLGRRSRAWPSGRRGSVRVQHRMELSFKASSTWADAQSSLLDVDGLRHVVQPMMNYVFVPEPSDRPWELPQFDRDLHSLRLRPIDFPDYNSIDTIDSRNVLRLGVRNRLQTKRRRRGGRCVELGTVHRLAAGNGGARSHASTTCIPTSIESRARGCCWVPSCVMTPTSACSREVNHTISLLPNDRWSLTPMAIATSATGRRTN